ncbi:MAG TPA: glycosyl hydrolase family 28-related protein [Roseiarcus sp.]|nr:glycosyl hydrolase family 28-related protein [Roseiarcus sp.]
MKRVDRIFGAALIALAALAHGAEGFAQGLPGGGVPMTPIGGSSGGSTGPAYNGVQISGTTGSGTGAVDNSSAINTALSGNSGKAVYLTSGAYHIANPINLPPGQCLYGDPGWQTVIDVDYDFSSSASGIIVVTPTNNGVAVKPCIKNIVVSQHLPADITARANASTAGANVLTVSSATGTIVSGMFAVDATTTTAIPVANKNYPTEVVGVSGSIVDVMTVGLGTGGSGYTNGTQTLTATGGTCATEPQFAVTVSGGAVQSASVTATGNASCSVWPSGTVATTGGGGTGATLVLGGIAGGGGPSDTIHFASPRSAALPLGSCNTTNAGSGVCKYPWVVYNNGAGNMDIDYLLYPSAWNGIYQRGGTFHFGYIQGSALNVAMDIDNSHNFPQIDDYEFWGFNLGSSNTASMAISDIFYDGSVVAANLGATDGLVAGKMQIWQGNLNFTANFSWGHFNSLMLDGGANLNIAACSWAQIANFYSTNSSYVTTPALYENASGCMVMIGSVYMTYSSGFGSPAILLSSGDLQITGGRLSDTIPNAAAPFVSNTGGGLTLRNMKLAGSPSGSGSVFVQQTGGWLAFQDNVFSGTPPTSGAGLSATDNSYNSVSGNNWFGWTFTPPGNLGVYNAGQPQDLKSFTSSGTYTPTPGLSFADVWCAAQGGGGGGGITTASGTANSGGSGGGAGSIAYGVFSAAQIGTSKAVSITNNANGGAAGASGTAGGNAAFGGSMLIAYGGGGGQVGVSAANSTGGGGSGQFANGQAGASGGGSGAGGGTAGGSGANGSATTTTGAGTGGGGGTNGAVGKSGGGSPWGPSGGGSGGGVSTAPAAFAGGAGGNAEVGQSTAGTAGSTSASGGAAPAAVSATPGSGSSSVSWPAGSGGGGGGSTAGAGAYSGGAGAAGGFPGGGGGGGGSALTTSTGGAGAGGQGGAGACYVLEHF